MKKLLVGWLFAAVLLGISSVSAMAADTISVEVNGETVAFPDAKPFVDANGRTLVPLRPIAEALGMDVEWDADNRQAAFRKSYNENDSDAFVTITFSIGSKIVAFEDEGGKVRENITMDTETVIVDDRTYAPVRYLAEIAGYTVYWDAARRTVVLTTISSGTSNTERLSIGVCIHTYDDLLMSYVRQEFLEVAGDMDVDLIMYDSKYDQATQNDQIDMMIKKGVSALVINLVDVTDESTAIVVEKAKAAGIPLIFINWEPDLDIVKTYENARFVGTNPQEAGMMQGEIASLIWKSGNWDKNGDGVMQYVMIMGEANYFEAKLRTQYSVETIEANGVKTECLAQETANWTDDQAEALMDQWKDDIGLDKIEFILCNNDFMAKGAVYSLNKSGYNTGADPDKYIPIVGIDAIPTAIDLINQGKMSGTVMQSPENMALASLELAINAANGEDFLSGTGYNYDESGIAIRLPFLAFTGR